MSSKKRKRSENAEAERSQENGEAHSLAGSTTTKTSKSKQAKGRKRQREDELKPESTQLLGKYEQKSKATDRTSDVTPSDAVPEQDYDHTMTPDTSQKSQRFIVFIGVLASSTFLLCHLLTEVRGNLPYSATTDSINAHFSKLRPRSVRHQTDKETGQSRGFAFLEFDGYDRMKTCLKLYHHSSFEDGLSNARRINVELTYVLYLCKN